jgi:hypothetical protein
MSLPGPRRRIKVEPMETPAQPEPKREPAPAPEKVPTPEKAPKEPVPA